MNERQTRQVERLAWLCDELRAGNEFSADLLWRWAQEARSVLASRVNDEFAEYIDRNMRAVDRQLRRHMGEGS
jgi:hypothetical protein